MGLLRDGDHDLAAHGVADVRTGVATTTATPFAVGSLTKSMVATVIAGLAAEGRVSLEDPPAMHVPEVADRDWARRASVRTMMANRSDIPLRTAWEFGFEGRPEDDADALRRLVADLGPSQATSGAAGGPWSYSNAGWCVLGRVVETVTGLAWEEAMRSRLGGLRDTSYGVTRAAGCAAGHEDSAAGPVPVMTVPSRAYAPAGTTTVSTAADLLRLAGWHLEEPGLAVTARGTRGGAHQRLARRVVPGMGALRLGAGARMGLGRADRWSAVVPPPAARAPGGRRPAHQQQPRTPPVSDAGPPPHEGRVRDRGTATRTCEPTPGAAGDLARFAGRYAWPDHDVVVRATDSALLITDGERTAEALPVDDRSFLVDPADPDNPTMTFGAFDAAGHPGVLYDMLWGLPRIAG